MTGEAFEDAKTSGWRIEKVPKGATPPRGPGPTPAPSGKYAAVPDSMKRERRWVVWNYQIRGGKRTKVPHTPGRGEAKSTDPDTWVNFEEAIHAEQFYSGIGFVLGDGWLGLDWDGVRDPDTGEWVPGILEEIKSVESYGELSPSTTGAHVILFGKKPGPRCKGKDEAREMYEHGRYFTVTGDHIPGTPDEVRDAAPGSLEAIYAKIGTSKERNTEREQEAPGEARRAQHVPVDLADEEIIALCEQASNGAKFSALWRGDTSGYSSPSEADFALLGILKFYTQDPAQLERLVRQSGLYREKWDRADYVTRTITEALNGVRETYSPGLRSLSPGEQYLRRIEHRRRMRAVRHQEARP